MKQPRRRPMSRWSLTVLALLASAVWIGSQMYEVRGNVGEFYKVQLGSGVARVAAMTTSRTQTIAALRRELRDQREKLASVVEERDADCGSLIRCLPRRIWRRFVDDVNLYLDEATFGLMGSSPGLSRVLYRIRSHPWVSNIVPPPRHFFGGPADSEAAIQSRITYLESRLEEEESRVRFRRVGHSEPTPWLPFRVVDLTQTTVGIPLYLFVLPFVLSTILLWWLERHFIRARRRKRFVRWARVLALSIGVVPLLLWIVNQSWNFTAWCDTVSVSLINGRLRIASLGHSLAAHLEIDQRPWGTFPPTSSSTIIDTEVWQAFAALAIAGLLVSAWNWRVHEGICLRCGYDLTGNVSGRCPECGAQWVGPSLHNRNAPR